jgi:5,10-methylenetetrahydrofolate reductase
VTAEKSLVSPAAGCPKKMIFGPCGGVRTDGRCEMQPGKCVFEQIVRWPGLPAAVAPVSAPLVLTDLSVPPADPVSLSATARILGPSCDAVLVGDHQDRPDFPPTMLAELLSTAGVVPWVTLACRDRNRVVLEQELQGLRQNGKATVLCVTGDGRAFDVRPDVTQVFDLDGTRLVALAAEIGVPAAVPETPTAPPLSVRPGRLVEKQHAGAGIAVLNHVGSPGAVDAFLVQARRAGLTIPVVASVAVYTDHRSAAVLTALPGLELDAAVVESVLTADDPVAAGIAAAVRQARALLAVDGVRGVNLSGMASERGIAFAAEVQAEIGHRIRSERDPQGAGNH